MADKIIESLSVSPGQVIAIWASTHSLDLVEALAVRIRTRGAFWTLRLTMESLLRRIGQSVPEPYLASVPEHELRWLADVSAIVEVRDHSGHIPEVSLARRRAMAAEWIALIDEAKRRGCRRIQVVNPTPALASTYGIPVEHLRQSYWRAVNVDYAALDRQQDRVAARLTHARLVHVTSALGTDLHLRIDDRPAHQDTDSLPRGEVYVAPHEDSAEGVAVIDRAFIAGKRVERLQLTFKNGRVVEVSARDADAVRRFRELLDASSGDKDAIAEFAIGLNPGAADPRLRRVKPAQPPIRLENRGSYYGVVVSFVRIITVQNDILHCDLPPDRSILNAGYISRATPEEALWQRAVSSSTRNAARAASYAPPSARRT